MVVGSRIEGAVEDRGVVVVVDRGIDFGSEAEVVAVGLAVEVELTVKLLANVLSNT